MDGRMDEWMDDWWMDLCVRTARLLLILTCSTAADLATLTCGSTCCRHATPATHWSTALAGWSNQGEGGRWVLNPWLELLGAGVGFVNPTACKDRFPAEWAEITRRSNGHKGGVSKYTRGRYHGGRRPSSDDSFHSPTVIPPSSLDKSSIMKPYHHRQTCSHTSPRRSPILGLSSADGEMTVGLWRLSSLDGRRPPWYRPQTIDLTRPEVLVIQCSLKVSSRNDSSCHWILIPTPFPLQRIFHY